MVNRRSDTDLGNTHFFFLNVMVNRRSDTDLGNTQSAPRGGERATVHPDEFT